MSEAKIGDIAELKTGPFGTQLHSNEYVKSGIPIINVKNIGYGELICNDLDYVSELTANRLKEHRLLEGDIVFGRKGSIDRHAYISKECSGWLQGSDCIRVRCLDKKKINPKFLSHFFNLDYVKKQLNAGAVGSTMASMNTDILKRVKVLLPDIEVQNTIERVLSTINDKIANNTSICSDLESMAKLIYDYWFVQFDFPDENGRPYKSSGGKMIWNEELKRDIPEGWEVTKLKNIFETERGISYNTANIETGKGIPMLNLATFRPGGGEYKSEGLKHFLGDCPKSKLLKPYDLIMCNTQQTSIKFETDIIGRAMLVPDIFEKEITFSHHVNVIRTKNDDVKFFLLYLFNSDYFHKYIAGFTNGTNILGLSFNGVEDFITAIPSNELLSKFAKIIQPVFEKKSCIFKENQDLASIRDFLLPMLMNGQVKVKS